MNVNIYRHAFVVRCPANSRRVNYRLEIETLAVIMVEEIISACTIETGYHEVIAEQLFRQFGGAQTLTAFHHGVEIETRRG